MPSTSTTNTSRFTTPFITFFVGTTHPAFQDAMTVRNQVFVEEQGIPAENELDEDDERSFHWVVYASVASSSTPTHHRVHQHHHPGASNSGSSTTRIPVGTIRLIPPPHKAHHQVHTSAAEPFTHPAIDENYIKLGRLATVAAFRGLGIGKLLVETALAWAVDHPEDISGEGSKGGKRANVTGLPESRKASIVSLSGKENNSGDVQEILAGGRGWNGQVLVHAQIAVKNMWKKFGFEIDESMGEWDEEGIMHVGLWKHLPIRKTI